MKKEMTEKETRQQDNSSGITGVVFGILSVMSGAPGIILGIVGFFFSLNQNKRAKNRWSKWGIALNIVGFVLGIIAAVSVYNYVSGAVSGLQGV